MNEPSCKKTKDLLANEDIENKGHVSTSTINGFIFAPERSSIPVLQPSRVDIRIPWPVKSPEHVRFRDKVLSCENNRIKN